MRKTESVTINGTKYELQQLGALQARRVLVRLGQVLSAPIARLANIDGGLDLTAIAGAVADALKGLDPDVLDEVCNAFAVASLVVIGPGQKAELAILFDDHFAGKTESDMLLWLGHCVRLNYPTFLGGQALTSRLASVVASASQSPTGSTGGSGG
jgi:hypothetical protein